MTQSLQALQAARNLEKKLLFAAPPEADLSPELRLIGFCMVRLGQRDLQLSSKPGADVIQLLDYNDIHHRRVSAPRDLCTNHWAFDHGSEFPLMIVYDGIVYVHHDSIKAHRGIFVLLALGLLR